MMHPTCLYPSVSLRCRFSRSLYYDDPTYSSDCRFDTNPLHISSSFGCSSCCCCCCGANGNSNSNSVYSTLPRINPSFLCNGLRQSTLIQFSPSRRLIIQGRRNQLCNSSCSCSSSSAVSRVSSCGDFDRGYYCKKLSSSMERRKLGAGRCRSYEDKTNEQSFGKEIDDDYVNEVELLLDLLAEEVGLENIGVRDRKRSEKKDRGKIFSEAETVNSRSVKRDLKSDHKAAEVRSSEKESRKLSTERRTFVEGANREKESRKLSEGVNRERKKQGSSSSSYYSVSSTGEYDSDNDVVVEHGDQKMDDYSSVYDEELVENVERRQGFGEKQSEILKKNTAEMYYGNQEWRKKSEKKLDVESSQSQLAERNSRQHSEKTERIVDQSQSGVKDELVTSVQELKGYHEGETADFTRQSKYKKQSNVVLEASGVRNFDKRMTSSSSSSSFETRMKNWEENATEVSDRVKEQREDKHQRVDELTLSKGSRMKSQQASEISDTRFTNTKNTSVSQRQSDITSSDESRLKSQQISDTRYTNVENTSVSQTQADITSSNESRLKSQQISDTRFTSIENTSVSQKQAEITSSNESRLKSQQISDARFTNIENTSVSQTQADITSSKKSRVKSQQISEISDNRFTNIENTSVSQTQSDIRTEKQELRLKSSSSSERRKSIEGKYSSSLVETVVEPTESTKTGRKTTKASSFHVGMPKEASSSYKALKLNPESSFQETDARFSSAEEQQKSSGQYVGEFFEKAEHQLTISEGELAPEDSDQHEQKSIEGNGSGTYDEKDDEQHEPKSSGTNSSGNYEQKDGTRGPSDELWHEMAAPGNTSDELAKRSGRSIWNVIGDVVRLRWGPTRSETHTPKSAGVSNQSTTSERWFSGHEPDDSSRKDVSTPSSSKEKQDSPLLKPMSPLVIGDSSIPLPSVRMRRSPAVRTTSVTTGNDQIVPKPDASGTGSGKMVVVEQPVPSRRKLARADQVSTDRFDEWEEAYTSEAQQRKTDEFFMREALSEAKKAADFWEVPVGAVLVQDGKIIARGYNLVEELRDSTAHAEMVCIREASNKLHSWRLSGTTLYVTLEPCAMCAGAILQARIDTLVWGAPNKLLGADGSWIRLFPGGDGASGSDNPAGPVHPFHPNMTVRRGVLSSECADVMQQFFQLRRKKKEKKPEAEPSSPPSPSPSCLPVSHHHNSKFVTKLHDVFNIMFCL